METSSAVVGAEPKPDLVIPREAFGAFGPRAAARMIDALISLASSGAAGLIGSLVLAVLAGMNIVDHGWRARVASSELFVSMGWGFGARLLQNVLNVGIAGTTTGKLILGFRIVGTDEKPCSFLGAVVRELAFFVDGLFFGLVAYSSMTDSPMRQRLGDKWGKTAVVKASALPDSAKREAPFVVAGILAGLSAEFVVVVCHVIRKGWG